MTADRTAIQTESTNLAPASVGLPGVLFQSITAMAPAAAVAFSIIVAANYAGGAAPLSVVVALVGCLLAANSMAQLARHLPSAGGLYTWTARGLHPTLGFLVGWAYALIEPFQIAIGSLLFGYLLSGTFNQEWGWAIQPVWIIASMACAIGVSLVGYFGVRISAETGTVLGAFEILVFTALGIWIIFKAGSRNTLDVFTTHYSTVKGFSGWTGVFGGSVYALLGFVGFEAAAPLAEEARSPRRNVGRAIIFATIGIGILYLFTTYASVVYYGPAKFGTFAASGNGNPWDHIARHVWGLGWIIVFIAVANSAFAGSNAGANAAARTWYSLGRIRVFPRPLERTHPRRKSPYVAIGVQFLITVGLVLGLGLAYQPFTAFVLLATMATLVVVVIYMAVNLSCIAFYWREHRSAFNPLLHLILPLLGTAVFVPAFFTAAGIGHSIFSFVSPLPSPVNRSGLIIGIWMVLGLVYLVYLVKRHPRRITETATVFEPSPGVPEATVEQQPAGLAR